MFKKLTLFILVCLSSVLFTYAQGVLSLDVGVGPTYGFGKFAQTNVNDNESGYSSIGGITNLYVGIKPTKHVGFCFYGGLAMHLLDISKLKTSLQSEFNTDLVATKKHHRYGFAMGGITVGAPVKNFYFLEGRVSAGYLWTEIPTVAFTADDIVYYQKYRTPGSGWAINAAFSFRYAIYGPLYIRATLDFLYSQPKFENVIIEKRINSEPTTNYSTYIQPIAAFGLTGGIGVSF